LATALEHFVPTNQTQLAENNAGENPRSWRKSKKLVKIQEADRLRKTCQNQSEAEMKIHLKIEEYQQLLNCLSKP
jgi:hypothetical protein